jgi:hypothetical protein
MTLYDSNLMCSSRRLPATRSQLDRELERLAFMLLKAWLDENPKACLSSSTNFEACVLYITTEMAIAAGAVGGAAGLAILTGGGSHAARSVCQQVLSMCQA